MNDQKEKNEICIYIYIYIYTPPPPLSPQGIGEGEGYTIVPSRSMQVLHTPRGYGGRLPHPVRGGGAYRDSPPHPLPVARLPGGGGVGYPPVASYYPPG